MLFLAINYNKLGKALGARIKRANIDVWLERLGEIEIS